MLEGELARSREAVKAIEDRMTSSLREAMQKCQTELSQKEQQHKATLAELQKKLQNVGMNINALRIFLPRKFDCKLRAVFNFKTVLFTIQYFSSVLHTLKCLYFNVAVFLFPRNVPFFIEHPKFLMILHPPQLQKLFFIRCFYLFE